MSTIFLPMLDGAYVPEKKIKENQDPESQKIMDPELLPNLACSISQLEEYRKCAKRGTIKVK